MKPNIYFISGIDTDAGKAIALYWYAKAIRNGQRVITQKFISNQQYGHSGTSTCTAASWAPAICLRGITKGLMPEIFSYPCSPSCGHASTTAYRLDKMRTPHRSLPARYDTVLVEDRRSNGSPLTGEYLTMDYIAGKTIPLIFVTSGKLGSINFIPC